MHLLRLFKSCFIALVISYDPCRAGIKIKWRGCVWERDWYLGIKMAARSRSDSPPLQRNPLKNNNYFDLIVFSTWDNVLGPRILREWGKDPPDDHSGFLQKPDDLRLIATYSIDVAEENETEADSICEKFFVLGEKSIMISTFLIRVECKGQDVKVFALSFVLPVSELEEWLHRRNFMENSCKRIISKNLMPNLKEELNQVCHLALTDLV